MADRALDGRRVLLVEDEYLIAEELRRELAEAGAVVVGPAATVKDAIDLISSDPAIDSAILDLNLRGEKAFAVADALMERGVLLVLTTGYDESTIPARFAGVARCGKPVDSGHIVHLLVNYRGSGRTGQ